jgi:hypothetical protein
MLIANQTNLKTHNTLKFTHQKVIILRQQICSIKKQRKSLPIHVYHDQLEDLYASLNDVKVSYQLNASKTDVMNEWCESNPSDLECRIYYY